MSSAGVTSVVIVTYNNEKHILSTLEALDSVDSLDLIVVDNASSDNTLEILRTCARSNLRLMPMAENLGFAAAVNVAAQAALGDVIVLLNPDAVIHGQHLERMADLIRRGAADVIGPNISQGAVGRVASAGFSPTLKNMVVHYYGISSALPNLRGHYLLRSQASQDVWVDWVTGACLVVSSRLFVKMGGLSERWFMYGEDIEFCHRVRQSGGRLLFKADISCQHAVGGSQVPVKNPRADWIVNLFDFYCSEFRPSLVTRFSWLLCVSLALYLKSLQSWVSPSLRGSFEAARFRHFASELVRHGVPLLKPRFSRE